MFGIIGGTGLYQLPGLTGIKDQKVPTPYGDPSALVTSGMLGSTPLAFLPRHGRHHTLLPSEINYRANIWALKSIGVRHILSVSAVGSLSVDLKPGHFVIPDQFIDLTKGQRAPSFFGRGIVGHITSSDPVCPELADLLATVGREVSPHMHVKRTYACVEGPRLGTKAESHYLRGIGAHVVGMTNVPEAFLAREAQIPYATLAVVTDYDSWMEDPGAHAELSAILAVYKKSLEEVQKMILRLAGRTAELKTDCSCRSAIKQAVMTPQEHLSTEHRALMSFLGS